MTRETRRKVSTFFRYFVLIAVGFIMVYPLIWMVGATFKTNNEIFSSVGFIPRNPTFDGYKNAMKSYGGDIDLVKAMINTYSIVLPKVIFTIVSATVTAYGFARFEFKGKNLLFAVLMSTLFLPQVVLNVPQYIMFNKFGWINHPLYLALIVPTMFATDTYFVFMLIQFLRNIPRELEEAAKIDGANAFYRFTHITLPLVKEVTVLSTLITTIWTFNDFEMVWILTGGGPSNATQILSTYGYTVGFMNLNLSRAISSSVAAIPFLIILTTIITKRMRDSAES